MGTLLHPASFPGRIFGDQFVQERPGNPKIGRNQPGKGRRQIHESRDGGGPEYTYGSGIRNSAPGGLESSGGFVD